MPVSEFQQWSKTAAFPQVPSRDAFRVWRKMKMHPRFDGSDLGRKADIERKRHAHGQHPTPDGSNPDLITDNERAASTASTTVTTTPPPPADGNSAQYKEITTPPQTDIGSSETTGVELQSSGRTPRNSRPTQLHKRRWHFRPVRELDATYDRNRFIHDDGAAALQATNQRSPEWLEEKNLGQQASDGCQ
ncbi:MAG: hypothetical protein OXI96_00475 [Acidimicrobiaceae bacterium]|nr:hypothetical protein [Acidimicrobiaceae bacterium]